MTIEVLAALVEMMLAEIADALSRDEDVKLASFGSFLVRAKRERIGHARLRVVNTAPPRALQRLPIQHNAT
jgi:Bacterial DNA-binding protein